MPMTEKEVLPKTHLYNRLERVRSSVNRLQDYNVSNIIFLNVESIINFIDTKPENNGFRECLKEVEPYIPLEISDENMDLFIDAAIAGDTAAVTALENAFIKNSLTKFISEVYNAKSDEAWADILKTCGEIRDYKSS